MEIKLRFAELSIDDKKFNKDVIIRYDGEIIKRPKHLSKPLADKYNHTPFSATEAEEVLKLIGDAKKLIIGNGLSSRMVVEEDAINIIQRNGLDVEIYNSQEAIERFLKYKNKGEKVALLVHITC